MWREGKSASQIAKHLEFCTRNAVIGKMNRLGLQKRDKAQRNERHRQESKIRAQKNANKALAASIREAKKRAKNLPKGRPAPSVPYTPIGLNIPFLELRADQCHAPMENGQLRCGHKVSRKDYCQAHADLFHRRVA
jgi:hypothetical protein